MTEQNNSPLLDPRRFERSVSPSPQAPEREHKNGNASSQIRSDNLTAPPSAVKKEASPENEDEEDGVDSDRATEDPNLENNEDEEDEIDSDHAPTKWHSHRREIDSEDELEEDAKDGEDIMHQTMLSPREKKKLKANEERDEDYDEGSAEESDDEDEYEDWDKEEVIAKKGTRGGLRSSDRK